MHEGLEDEGESRIEKPGALPPALVPPFSYLSPFFTDFS